MPRVPLPAALSAALVAALVAGLVALVPLDAASARRGAPPNIYAVIGHRGVSDQRGQRIQSGGGIGAGRTDVNGRTRTRR